MTRLKAGTASLSSAPDGFAAIHSFRTMWPRTQIQRGVALATGAALLFGATVPLLQRASAAMGVLTSASLLYLGAATSAGVLLLARGRRGGERLLRPQVLVRVVAVALLGAVCAPILLVMGIRQADAATTSLLLTLEMPFTLLLARVFFHEYLGRRAITATILVLVGSLFLAGRLPATSGELLGVALVVGAVAAWALDNVLSRTLADQDSMAVVALKGAIGGAVSGILAVAVSAERLPEPGAAASVLAIGAVGYGMSLHLYLRAQALVGAARTASVFSAAPFVGATIAFLLGSAWPGGQFAAAGVLLIAGVALHVSERHRHTHTHEPLVHEHLHTHDDGHHAHVHEPPFMGGAHSHVHQHLDITHEHDHGDDIHHRHPH